MNSDRIFRVLEVVSAEAVNGFKNEIDEYTNLYLSMTCEMYQTWSKRSTDLRPKIVKLH